MSPQKPVSITANLPNNSNNPTTPAKWTTPKKISRKHITYGKQSSTKIKTLTQMWEWGKLTDSESGKGQNSFKYQAQDKDDGFLQKRKVNDDFKIVNRAPSKKGNGAKKLSTSESNRNHSGPESLKIEEVSPGRKSEKIPAQRNPVVSKLAPWNVVRKGEIFTSEDEPDEGSEDENVSQNDPFLKNELDSISAYRSSITENLSRSSKHRTIMSPSPQGKDHLGTIQTPKTPLGNFRLEVPSSQSPATPMTLHVQRSGEYYSSSKRLYSNSPTPKPTGSKFNFSPRGSHSPMIRDSFYSTSTLSVSEERMPPLRTIDINDISINYNLSNNVSSTPHKRSSPGIPVTSTPVNLQQLDGQVPNISTKLKDPTLINVNLSSGSNFKGEILDSEAESDEEFEISEFSELIEENRPDKKVCHNNFNAMKSARFFSPKTPAAPKFEQEEDCVQTPPQLAQDTKTLKEILERQSLTELETLVALDEPSGIRNREEQKSEEVPLVSSGFKSFSKYSPRGITPTEETQYMTTQRLSSQYLAQMAPRTSESDIFMSIDPQRVTEIKNRSRDHETRRYKLPPLACRVWLYERSPVSAVRFMAEISPAKSPGEIIDEAGIGNKAFNLQKKPSPWTAYEILQLYELSNPLSLKKLKEKEWLKCAPKPMRWTKIPPAVADELVANIKSPFFNDFLDTDLSMVPISRSDHIQEANLQEPDSIPKFKDNSFIEPQPIFQNKPVLKDDIYASSQATTVDLSQAETPRQSSTNECARETPTKFELTNTSSGRPTPFSMASSVILTKSQLLPDSLLNDFASVPPPAFSSSEYEIEI